MKAKPEMTSKIQARVNEARLHARVALASKLIADCQASLGYTLSRGQRGDLLKDNYNDWSDADCDKIEAIINGETTMATLILNSPQYAVTSYGKGTAYLIERKADGAQFHVQGDEAAQFHDAIFEQDIFDYDVAISHLYSEAFSLT